MTITATLTAMSLWKGILHCTGNKQATNANSEPVKPSEGLKNVPINPKLQPFAVPTIAVKSCWESCVHHFTSYLIPLLELFAVLICKMTCSTFQKNAFISLRRYSDNRDQKLLGKLRPSLHFVPNSIVRTICCTIC